MFFHPFKKIFLSLKAKISLLHLFFSEIPWIPLQPDLPFLKNIGEVSSLQAPLHILLHQDHHHALPFDSIHSLVKVLDYDRTETHRNLVEDDQLGL